MVQVKEVDKEEKLKNFKNMYKGFIIKERIELSTLLKIIREVPKSTETRWYLLEIEASGDLTGLNTSMLELMKECDESNFGKGINLIFLMNLFHLIESLDSITIFGGNVNFNLIDFQATDSLNQNAEYVFEFLDSNYWRITSHNTKFIVDIESILKKSVGNKNYSIITD